MSYLDAILLGIIQGLTEFLPISSSGHLVLVQELLGVKQTGVSFELLVHLGTLLAVLVYFRDGIVDLLRAVWTPSMKVERKMIALLAVGTVPAGFAGVLFKDFFEEAFSSPVVTSCMLLATGLILLSTRFVSKGNRKVSWLTAIVIGVAQSLAIMPGISRSGSTIAAGMLAGVQPSRAAEFSFLLAVPAIAGAVVFKARDLLAISTVDIGPFAAGSLFAFAFGLIAVYAVLKTIRRGKFEYFAYYCFAAGGVGLYLFS
ncbi:MAG: undecaprenyl-diphosphate phosphatase [bacterium]|nr:undecaprenyl-diphosphate phosphatase [bacterium]